ncbi:flagellar basal body protein FliL [Falsiroseomonas bella]|uniref:Flagellar protein FliL n=1 Tax=Falsiroseomonas bella TaxID=2184016 RepID=A0A317FFP3_9PROT|nr:flagellar basal body-associated FliL family protein [Falsiroseomonas bella]PWS36867.1 flagellar basal body protein FliL [Falsiroseomonas bella]
MAAAKEEKKPEGEAGEPRKGGGKKKLLLLALPLLLIGLGAGLWFGGILPPLLGMGAKPADATEEAAAQPPPAPTPAFVDLPEIVSNLNVPNGRRASFVRLRAKLEISDSTQVAAVTEAMPRLVDLFATYLREVRPDELRGSAGSHRLREELIARASIAASPARVTDVLFVEILVQ